MFDPRCKVRKLWRHMSGHVRTKSADFAIYCIWTSFVAFWSVLLYFRQHNWYLWISRSHIQLPWCQGHPRSQVWCAVSVAHFSRYNSNFTAVLSLESLFRAKTMPDLESMPTNWLYISRHVSMSWKVTQCHLRSMVSDDLEWPNFLLRSISGCFEAFNIFLHWFTHFGQLYSIPKIVVKRTAASVGPDLRSLFDLRP